MTTAECLLRAKSADERCRRRCHAAITGERDEMARTCLRALKFF